LLADEHLSQVCRDLEKTDLALYIICIDFFGRTIGPFRLR
jgi:hypothetical protein